MKWDRNADSARRSSLQSFAGGPTFFSFDWCQVERVEGRRDWTRVDHAVRSAAALGYSMMLKIRAGSCWATKVDDAPHVGRNDRTVSSLPRDLTRYADFVTAAVDRYASLGVHAYALENEVNARNFWAGTADEYRRLIEVGAPAVHRADPKAIVLDGGLSSIGYGAVVTQALYRTDPAHALTFYRQLFARRFVNTGFVFPPARTTSDIDQMLASDTARRALAVHAVTVDLARRKLIDAYQLHYYEPAALLPTVIRTIRSEIGVTPIQAWELGVAWPGADFDVQRHATEVAILGAEALLAGIRQVVYLPLAFSPGGLRDQEIWRGLLDPDGTPRPAAAAYHQLQAATAGRSSWRPLSGGWFRGLVITGATGTTVIAWSDGAATMVSATSGWRAASAVGHRLPWDAAHELRIGAEPVFLSGGSIDAALLAQLDGESHP